MKTANILHIFSSPPCLSCRLKTVKVYLDTTKHLISGKNHFSSAILQKKAIDKEWYDAFIWSAYADRFRDRKTD